MNKAYELIKHQGNQNLFVFGDHASRHIPTVYNTLGLSGDDLTRHIAWDIGTEVIVRRLCEHFQCGGQLASVSRLVIDMNRDPEAAGLIPEMSDGTIIVGNENLTPLEKQARVDDYYGPYHAKLGESLDALSSPFVLSIHSFTPHPHTGDARKTDIGLLIKHDEESAEQFRQSMEANHPEYKVGMNLPYSAYDLNYTVDAHVAIRRLRHLAIEIRQDHISTDKDASLMADRLATCLKPVLQHAVT